MYIRIISIRMLWISNLSKEIRISYNLSNLLYFFKYFLYYKHYNSIPIVYAKKAKYSKSNIFFWQFN